MLRLGFGGCLLLLLIVACSCRTLFLVKHWFKYFIYFKCTLCVRIVR